MNRAKAIQKIMSDMRLTPDMADYVNFTIGYLGCGPDLDLETIKAVKEVIKKNIL